MSRQQAHIINLINIYSVIESRHDRVKSWSSQHGPSRKHYWTLLVIKWHFLKAINSRCIWRESRYFPLMLFRLFLWQIESILSHLFVENEATLRSFVFRNVFNNLKNFEKDLNDNSMHANQRVTREQNKLFMCCEIGTKQGCYSSIGKLT